MRKHQRLILLTHLTFASMLVASPAATKPASAAKSSDVEPTPIAPPTDELSAPSARLVRYGLNDVVAVKTKLRYTTLIILPKTETILDFTCGDKEYWVVNGSQNFAYVKPAKLGAETNLNLVTASGNIYSFLLSEVSQTPKVVPDLKLFLELKDDAMLTASRATPRFVPAETVDAYKDQLERAKQEAQRAREDDDRAVQQGINRFVVNVRFPYRFEAGKKPFNVRAMYHDDRFTYIQARPEETPTLYEIKDKEPNLVNFTYKDGVYVVDKILDKGYFVVGKQKLAFTREE